VARDEASDARSPISRKVVPALLLALLLAGLHAVHLGADTPARLSSSAGPYVDEGYKTLSARNLAVFGSPQWHPQDSYPGWIDKSPLTQALYYLAFRALGVRVESARLVTLAFFALLLLAAVWALAPRYSGPLLAGAVLALGLEHTLFFYSRIALFEIPLAALLYVLLFGLARYGRTRPLTAVAAVVATTGLLHVGVKESAMLYAGPVLLAALFYAGRRLELHRHRAAPAFAIGALVLVAVFVLVGWGLLEARMRLVPLRTPARMLLNPAAAVTPILVVAGLFCALHGLLCARERYLDDLYRLSLVAIVLVSPTLLALFPYHPLRYYVPILPAYVLLVLEWIHLRSWRDPLPERLPWPVAAFFAFAMGLLFFYAALGLNDRLLLQLPLAFGSEAGVSERNLLRVVAPLCAVLGLLAWLLRRAWMRPQPLLALGALALWLWAVQVAFEVGSFLFRPTYQAQAIRADLAELIGPDQSVAGDWAPFFALGTGIRALYSSEHHNRKRLGRLHVDYFLYSDTLSSRSVVDMMHERGEITLGPPLYESRYAGRAVILYPVLRLEPPVRVGSHS
jgi:hypothetical protein